MPKGLDVYTQELLCALKKPQGINERGDISIDIDAEEQKRAWMRQNERTASEPSGLSFSHYKSMIGDLKLLQTDADIRALPLQYGFVPQDWCRITDVEILKKEGVLDVDKMRLIQLMDAEANMNNKMIGKRVMQQAEEVQYAPA